MTPIGELSMQDRFIHGLNVRIKHKVQIEAMKGIGLDDLIEFAEMFEKQGNEITSSKGKMVASSTPMGTGASKWNGQQQRVDEPHTSILPAKAPLKAIAGPQPMKTNPYTGGSRLQCFKCKGCGHFAQECGNQRVMVITPSGDIYSEDEEEPSRIRDEELCPDTNIGFSSDDELVDKMKTLVVLRMLNVQPKRDEYMEQRSNIFHMKCKVLTKTCLEIIDGGSCTKVVSHKLVTNLGLENVKHPSPYRLHWLGDGGELKVTTQAKVPLKISSLEEKVLCDVIPMSACHILLGRSWEYDNKAIRDGYTNEYSYADQGTKVHLSLYHLVKSMRSKNI